MISLPAVVALAVCLTAAAAFIFIVSPGQWSASVSDSGIWYEVWSWILVGAAGLGWVLVVGLLAEGREKTTSQARSSVCGVSAEATKKASGDQGSYPSRRRIRMIKLAAACLILPALPMLVVCTVYYSPALSCGLFLVPILALGWLVLRDLRRVRSEERSEEGFCAACEYDLTGNTSGVCPECGTPVVVKRDDGTDDELYSEESFSQEPQD